MCRFNTWFLGVVLLLSSISAKPQQRPAENESRTIAVAVEGHASSIADEGTLHVGFSVFGPDAATAYTRGSKISIAIVAALTQAGVQQASIQSETQFISQVSQDQLDRFSAPERAEKAYRLQQSWQVKLPAEAAGQLLAIAVKAGANDSGAIDWSMRDPVRLHAMAVEDALLRAKATASEIARGMGVTLGPLISAANRAPALLPGEIDSASWGQGFGYGTGGGMMSGGGGGGGGGGGSFRNLLALRPRKIEEVATISAIYAVQ